MTALWKTCSIIQLKMIKLKEIQIIQSQLIMTGTNWIFIANLIWLPSNLLFFIVLLTDHALVWGNCFLVLGIRSIVWLWIFLFRSLLRVLFVPNFNQFFIGFQFFIKLLLVFLLLKAWHLRPFFSYSINVFFFKYSPMLL
jgi:hypothetical protein